MGTSIGMTSYGNTERAVLELNSQEEDVKTGITSGK